MGSDTVLFYVRSISKVTSFDLASTEIVVQVEKKNSEIRVPKN